MLMVTDGRFELTSTGDGGEQMEGAA